MSDKLVERYNMEDSLEWRKWVDKIPFLTLPNWEIKPIPPFAGALVRFQFKKGDKTVSGYLDVTNSLGIWTDDAGDPEPYWEIYPAADGDTFRCALDQTFALEHAIAEALACP